MENKGTGEEKERFYGLINILLEIGIAAVVTFLSLTLLFIIGGIVIGFFI